MSKNNWPINILFIDTIDSLIVMMILILIKLTIALKMVMIKKVMIQHKKNPNKEKSKNNVEPKKATDSDDGIEIVLSDVDTDFESEMPENEVNERWKDEEDDRLYSTIKFACKEGKIGNITISGASFSNAVWKALNTKSGLKRTAVQMKKILFVN